MPYSDDKKQNYIKVSVAALAKGAGDSLNNLQAPAFSIVHFKYGEAEDNAIAAIILNALKEAGINTEQHDPTGHRDSILQQIGLLNQYGSYTYELKSGVQVPYRDGFRIVNRDDATVSFACTTKDKARGALMKVQEALKANGLDYQYPVSNYKNYVSSSYDNAAERGAGQFA